MHEPLILDAAHYAAFAKHIKKHHSAWPNKPCMRSQELYDNWFPGRPQADLLVDDNGYTHGKPVPYTV